MSWPLATNEDTPKAKARAEYERTEAEAKNTWQSFEAKRRQSEAKGIDQKGLAELEGDYAVYEQAAKRAETAKAKYVRLLEAGAGAPIVTTAGQATDLLRSIKSARMGDGEAAAKLSNDFEAKGWIEGTDGSGGYLVSPEVLPGYLAARKASSPLRERCASFSVNSDTVWLTVEGNSIAVAHTAEAATKTNSTGTLTQKISTVFKVAGTTNLSDELLTDSNGRASQLVSKQFAQQIGIAIDTAIISGTGTGQPTGIRNAAGVTSTAVDGQNGKALADSIFKAVSRLAVKYYAADTIVMNPRDAVKFDIATDASGLYMFPQGISSRFPGVDVILDANIPSNLGAGTNESVIIVGDFKSGGYFFSRQPLTVEASRDAGWVSDETVFRGVDNVAGFAPLRGARLESGVARARASA